MRTVLEISGCPELDVTATGSAHSISKIIAALTGRESLIIETSGRFLIIRNVVYQCPEIIELSVVVLSHLISQAPVAGSLIILHF